ncbi:uncharacterized protein LOC119729505 [Patiria miniata]|uniref:Uncharacterized protein n=1 Tax=Patiria miniata TaxID=46514 RepID=A0A914A2E8_PATMI|nr:uncharacterized protein LOC119729505 [Patiria miniata]
MAASTDSVFASVIQGHLECSICHARYQEPKMLDCSHSFCLGCLQELKLSQQPDDDRMICPLCQMETMLPEGGVAKLTDNGTLLSLIEDIIKQEQILLRQGSKVSCQACDEESEAISRCLDCEQYLCKECQKAHQRWAALRAHNITPCQGEFDAEKDSKMNISKCGIHPNHELNSYCVSCEMLICKICASSSHEEPMHTPVNFSDAIEIFLQEANDENSQRNGNDERVELSECCTPLRSRLAVKLAATNKQISQNAEKKIRQIRRQELQLKQMAQAKYRQKDKRLAEMAFATQTLKMVCSEMTHENCFRILKLRQELLHDYRDVAKTETGALNHDLSFIGFRDTDKKVELGTILVEEKWERLHQSWAKGRAIAAFSTGDMLVVNTTQRNFTELSSEGAVLNVLTVSQLEGCDEDPNVMKHPTGLAVDKDDHFHVLIDSEINIFNRDYQLIQQFTAGDFDEESDDSKPTCIALDDSLIAVGFEDKEQISLHNTDGSLIRTVPAPMIAKALTISNKRLLYTSYKEEKIICIDFEGNNIFTVNMAENVGPLGVRCDQAGDIYVLVLVCDEEETQLHHYNSDGKFIESLITGLDGHVDLTFTHDGKIAMCGSVKTQIWH